MRELLDYETNRSYSLTMEASDGKGGTASIAVTVSQSGDINDLGTYAHAVRKSLGVAMLELLLPEGTSGSSGSPTNECAISSIPTICWSRLTSNGTSAHSGGTFGRPV